MVGVKQGYFLFSLKGDQFRDRAGKRPPPGKSAAEGPYATSSLIDQNPSFLSRVRLSFIHRTQVGGKATSTRPRRILIMGFGPDQNRGPW